MIVTHREAIGRSFAALQLQPRVVVVATRLQRHRREQPEACGILAGAMTDPPALAFAQKAHDDSATSVAYATVYPLTMLLRVRSARLLVCFAS